MILQVFVVLLSATVQATAALSPFYGLALASNSPATFALVQLDAAGQGTQIGPSHSELFGESDLVASANGIFYYLGDTSAGTTLVGLNLTNGVKVCSKAVPLSEVGFVGLGQSLSYDETTDTLVLSGLNANRTTHSVYRSSARTCGPFHVVDHFADATYIPMIHSSSLDAKNQRLFTSLALTKNTGSIGIIDLTGKDAMVVVGEGTPSPADTLVSMHWDSISQSLVGIAAAENGGLAVHSFDLSTKKWKVSLAVTGVPSDWNALLGNSATVSTFDTVGRLMYFIAGDVNSGGNIEGSFLAAVNVDNGKLVSYPKMSRVGLGGSGYEALLKAK